MTPSPAPVLDLIDAFRRSKAMFTAVRFGIFDRLAERPRSAAEMAAVLSLPQDTTERLLDACAGLGFLQVREGRYRNTDVAQAYLRGTSEDSLTGYVLYSDQVLYPMWAHLEDALREAAPRWKQTFGLDGPIFDHFFRTGEAMRTFLLGMHGFGKLSSPAVVAAFDLSGFRLMADLGGATGHLVCAACERYSGLRGVLFDLPRVIEFARPLAGRAPGGDRVDCLAGDFFTDTLPEADLFALGRILHDWSEEKIRRLLGRVFERLPAGGGLLLAEKLLLPDKSGPVPAHMQSLNMLVCTEGKERTLAEYGALLESAGFTGVQGAFTGAPLDAVLARKA